MLLAVAMYEWLTVMTSSPVRTPTANSARCRAVVPLETAQACGAPTKVANPLSKAATSGPCVTQPERMARSAADTSSRPSCGRATGMNLDMRENFSEFALTRHLSGTRGTLGIRHGPPRLPDVPPATRPRGGADLLRSRRSFEIQAASWLSRRPLAVWGRRSPFVRDRTPEPLSNPSRATAGGRD